MPVVVIETAAYWAPVPLWDPSARNDVLRPEGRFVQSLAEAMPDIVANAMNVINEKMSEISDESSSSESPEDPTNPDHVWVKVPPAPIISVNGPDISVTIELAFTEIREAVQRWIRSLVGEGIREYADSKSALLVNGGPAVDIDVHIIPGCGASYDKDGVETAKWPKR